MSQIVVLTPDELSTMLTAAAEKAARTVASSFMQEIPRLRLTVDAPDDLVPRESVMSMLDVSATTLRNWEDTGTLVPVRHGHLVFYRRSELLKKEEKRRGR